MVNRKREHTGASPARVTRHRRLTLGALTSTCSIMPIVASLNVPHLALRTQITTSISNRLPNIFNPNPAPCPLSQSYLNSQPYASSRAPTYGLAEQASKIIRATYSANSTSTTKTSTTTSDNSTSTGTTGSDDGKTSSAVPGASAARAAMLAIVGVLALVVL